MKSSESPHKLHKASTGIVGFDDITLGGLPQGRTTLLSGYAGCGKTVFSMYFIVNGILQQNEPGVFLSMEENADDLRKNFASFGFNIDELEKDGQLILENINLNKPELHSAGTFDLTALFVRIEEALAKTNAKRLVIDTFELLFNEINNPQIFRRELLRLINWLKEKNITSIFTSEVRDDGVTEFGLEEYIADCVVVLKNMKEDNIYTRRLHILKYRGSFHGTNEYPFLIDSTGITLMPITNVKMPDSVSSEVVSCGIPSLDEKLEKKGLYIGTSTLVIGTSGVGKTSLAMSFCFHSLKNGKKCLFYAFEESAAQLRRNIGNLGMDLGHYQSQGLLEIVSDRPSITGIEMHLVTILKKVQEFEPDVIVFDPVTTLIEAGTPLEVRNLLLRLMDYLKSHNKTIMVTSLVSKWSGNNNDLGISSLVDNIINLENLAENNHINHAIHVEKIRGMSYERKNYVLNFTKSGIEIQEMNKH